MDLRASMATSMGGMRAQSMRMAVVAENIANADSVTGGANGGPYQRKILTFTSEVDRATGMTNVVAGKPTQDTKSPNRVTYDPSHPMANENGLVTLPNVNTLKENIDMREASRLYEANMAAVESAKQMMVRSLDLLR